MITCLSEEPGLTACKLVNMILGQEDIGLTTRCCYISFAIYTLGFVLNDAQLNIGFCLTGNATTQIQIMIFSAKKIGSATIKKSLFL